MFLDVAVDQVLHGRGIAPLGLLTSRVLACIDPPGQFLGLGSRGGRGPCRVGAYRVASLEAVDAIVDEEGARTARVPLGRREDTQAKATDGVLVVGVPERDRAALRRAGGLDEIVRQLGHGSESSRQ